jgi:phosphonate transport system substrate-binding protein
VDGGGIEDRILFNLQEEGAIEPDSVRVIEESEPIEGYPWVVRDALSDELKEQISQAFLDIDDPALLNLLRADGYERVEPEDYDYVEEQATELDLLTAQ